MRSRFVICLGLILLLMSAVEAASPKRGSPLPVLFFRNGGEAPSTFKFIARSPELSAYFSKQEAVLVVRGTEIRVSFLGANPNPVLSSGDPQPGKANFLIGEDQSRWRSNVDLYRTVSYKELYPGIDMNYGGTQRRLKSEFLVAPGADPGMIRIRYSGFEKIFVDRKGGLVFRLPNGELREDSPEVYQQRDGLHIAVKCRYDLHDDGTVGFALGEYDPSLEVVIDPVLSYSTYLGGSGFDAVTGLAVDPSGNAYVTGYTDSLDFPIAGAIQGTGGGGVDAFIAKLNPAGNALLYATYIGGSGDDRARGLTLDSSGNVTITGSTTSPNFPRVAAYQTVLAGGKNAFVAKLNATGNLLVYSTYFGGSGYDNGNAIASDSSGAVYVAGDTTSINLPTLSAAQTTNRGRQEGFVMKLNSAGALQYSTYLGGTGDERALAIAVDSTGAAYITGATTSPDFPVVNAFQALNGGGQDVFVTKLSAAGNSFVYSTYLGGSGGVVGSPESGNGIAVDSAGSAYVTGVTSSPNFPRFGALQTGHAGGGLDAFVSKFTAAGSAVVYSTYLGGIGLDTATAIAVDSSGNAFVTGNTTSPDFPLASPIQSLKSGNVDAFIVTLNSSGSALNLSTYLGGNSSDGGTAIALNGTGSIWIAGQTTSTNFPLQSPYQAVGYSEGNGFVASMTQAAQKAVMLTPVPSSTLAGSTVTFTWSNGGAAMYWLDVGTIRGKGDIFGANLATATSKTVVGVPVNGSIIYVKIWSSINGTWQSNEYTYTAAVTSDPKAAMISPTPSTTLPGSTVTFTWNNSGAAMYWLDIGSTAGRGDIFGANLGTATSKTVSGIPTTGAVVYVRLWSSVSGTWVFRDYTYTASGSSSGVVKSTMISPTPGSTLPSTSVTFSWVNTGASMYWLDVGPVQGHGDTFGANTGTATSAVVNNIPTGHVVIYVRLWTSINGVWQYNDYTYTGP